MDLDEFHARTATTALVVVAGDAVVHERYFGGAGRRDRPARFLGDQIRARPPRRAGQRQR